MFIKIMRSHRDIVTLCDSEILGKKFEEGNFQLEVKESFYKGEKITPEEAVESLKDWALEDATFNIVGEKSVQTALKAGIIDEKAIGKIEGIPYSLVLA